MSCCAMSGALAVWVSQDLLLRHRYAKRSPLGRECGAGLVEYVLILALVALATVGAVAGYGISLLDLWDETVRELVDTLVQALLA